MTWDGGAVVAVVVLAAGYLRFYVRSLIREENDKLLARINGTYVRSMDSTLTGAEIERRLVGIEAAHGSHHRAKA